MRNAWYVLPCAGAIAVAGCAGAGGASGQNPTSRAVEQNERSSAEALQQAYDAQQKAMAQQQRVASAEQEVQKAQQRLERAQGKLKQQQAKELQLQREANRMTQRSTREAEAHQQDATIAMRRQDRQIASGQQTFAGQVARSTGSELTMQPRGGGHPMSFRITNGTRVLVDGRQGSIDQVLEGEDARVSYELGGTTPRATSVLIQTGSPAGSGGPGTGHASSTRPTESGTGSGR